MHRTKVGKALGRQHRLAATAAAVADKIDVFADILAELHEIILVGLMQLKVMQISCGAEQDLSICSILWRQ